MLLDVECSKASHPFVSLKNDLLLGTKIIMEKAFHDKGCSYAEHACFVVVAISTEAVHTEVLPYRAVDIILELIVGLKTYKDNTRFAWDVPTACANMETTFRGHLYPGTPHLRILQEEGILFLLPYIRTDEQEPVWKLFLQSLGTSREHRIDAAHLVANLPAALENEVWYQSVFSH